MSNIKKLTVIIIGNSVTTYEVGVNEITEIKNLSEDQCPCYCVLKNEKVWKIFTNLAFEVEYFN